MCSISRKFLSFWHLDRCASFVCGVDAGFSAVVCLLAVTVEVLGALVFMCMYLGSEPSEKESAGIRWR